MGCPLRKLHHFQFLRAIGDICNIRTMDRMGIHNALKRMDTQDFVSKNDCLGKADRKKDPVMVDKER
jgi:hypothetical protein